MLATKQLFPLILLIFILSPSSFASPFHVRDHIKKWLTPDERKAPGKEEGKSANSKSGSSSSGKNNDALSASPFASLMTCERTYANAITDGEQQQISGKGYVVINYDKRGAEKEKKILTYFKQPIYFSKSMKNAFFFKENALDYARQQAPENADMDCVDYLGKTYGCRMNVLVVKIWHYDRNALIGGKFYKWYDEHKGTVEITVTGKSVWKNCEIKYGTSGGQMQTIGVYNCPEGICRFNRIFFFQKSGQVEDLSVMDDKLYEEIVANCENNLRQIHEVNEANGQ